jgi:hypothetical protein
MVVDAEPDQIPSHRLSLASQKPFGLSTRDMNLVLPAARGEEKLQEAKTRTEF